MALRILTPSGDYPARNRSAAVSGASVYADLHGNAFTPSKDYALVEVMSWANAKTLAFANTLAQEISACMGIPNAGVRKLGRYSRGAICIRNFPRDRVAVICEPANLSNPKRSAWLRVPGNLDKLADAYARAFRQHFPEGTAVALSIGHLGKTTSPKDRGASLVADGTPYDGDDTEADINVALRKRLIARLATGVPAVGPASPPAPTTLAPYKWVWVWSGNKAQVNAWRVACAGLQQLSKAAGVAPRYGLAHCSAKRAPAVVAAARALGLAVRDEATAAGSGRLDERLKQLVRTGR